MTARTGRSSRRGHPWLRPWPHPAVLGRGAAQLRRRRTLGIFAFMLALPLLLVLAFAVGDEPRTDVGSASSTWQPTAR